MLTCMDLEWARELGLEGSAAVRGVDYSPYTHEERQGIEVVDDEIVVTRILSGSLRTNTHRLNIVRTTCA